MPIKGRQSREPISTHALREEGDGGGRPNVVVDGDFYPRPPRGGRPRLLPVMPRPSKFLPTPSARRATNGCYCV